MAWLGPCKMLCPDLSQWAQLLQAFFPLCPIHTAGSSQPQLHPQNHLNPTSLSAALLLLVLLQLLYVSSDMIEFLGCMNCTIETQHAPRCSTSSSTAASNASGCAPCTHMLPLRRACSEHHPYLSAGCAAACRGWWSPPACAACRSAGPPPARLCAAKPWAGPPPTPPGACVIAAGAAVCTGLIAAARQGPGAERLR